MKLRLLKIWQKFKALLNQGLTPKQLSISLVVSTLVSVFPIFGISTIALTCIAISFRLNLPIMIGFSYIIGPLKFLVLLPFINLGALVFGVEHTLLTFEAIKARYDYSFYTTVKELSYELICGTVGWALTAIPFGIIVYYLLKAFLIYLDKVKTNRLNVK